MRGQAGQSFELSGGNSGENPTRRAGDIRRVARRVCDTSRQASQRAARQERFNEERARKTERKTVLKAILSSVFFSPSLEPSRILSGLQQIQEEARLFIQLPPLQKRNTNFFPFQPVLLQTLSVVSPEALRMVSPEALRMVSLEALPELEVFLRIPYMTPFTIK